jgi:osmotically-inducible protein OsmY
LRYLKVISTIQGAIGLLFLTWLSGGNAQISATVADPPSASRTASIAEKSSKAENRRLQKAVVRRLSQTRGLSASNILVVARNGVVTLGGSVPASDQFDLAVAATKGVDGVSEVKNDLTVRSEGF